MFLLSMKGVNDAGYNKSDRCGSFIYPSTPKLIKKDIFRNILSDSSNSNLEPAFLAVLDLSNSSMIYCILDAQAISRNLDVGHDPFAHALTLLLLR
jgi:hypothetical protein